MVDVEGNTKKSATYSFDIINVYETISSEIKNINAYPNPQIAGNYVNISFDVTNDNAVDIIDLFIYDPFGKVIPVEIIHGEWYFNRTYDDVGIYQYFITAEFTNGNSYFSMIDTFSIVKPPDNTPPETTKNIFSPKYGINDLWVTSNTGFNLSANDDDSGVNKIYYRTWYNNIWTPIPGSSFGINNNFEVYGGNFTLNGEGKHYVKFYSIDKADNHEEIHNQTHYVDDKSPTTNYSLYGDIGENNWFKNYAEFTLTANDTLVGVGQTFYRINNENWQIYPDSFNISSYGFYTVDYYSIDKLANTETIQSFGIKIDNRAPIIDSVSGPVVPIEVDTEINITGEFHDTGVLTNHTAFIDWGDGTTSNGIINESNNSGIFAASHIYNESNVSTITVTVTDEAGLYDTEIFQYVVVYDSSGGFVTGGGWINSPEGAYTPDPNLTGTANFGFVSKYKKGQQNLTGNTEFQFHAADMNFHSDSYDWLVIAGHKAMYKGNGTINGTGNYGFMISAIDEKLTPSTDVDMFRIKIWDKDNNDEVIYDNQLGDDEDEDPTTEIAGGQIVIHKG